MINAMLTNAPVSRDPAVFYLSGPYLPWLWPALACAGIFLQIASIVWRRRSLVLAGFILVASGAFPDRDITLLTGDFLACLGLWLSFGDAARKKIK